MATDNVDIHIAADASDLAAALAASKEAADELAEQFAEDEAKAEWDAFQPEPGTIEWYDKFFAECSAANSAPRGGYNRERLAYLADYKKEREDFGDDEAWLVILREQYVDAESMTAEFEQGALEEKAGKSGHTLARVLAGELSTSPASVSEMAHKAAWVAETINSCTYKDRQGGNACVEIDTDRYCVSCSARS